MYNLSTISCSGEVEVQLILVLQICCWRPGFQIVCCCVPVCFFLQGAWMHWYLLQLLLQAGTPVTNLHQATNLRTKCLSTSVRERGCSPWSPGQPVGVENAQDLAPVLAPCWSWLHPGRLDECFPTVREDFLIDISINTWFVDFLPLCFSCFQVMEKT